MSLENASLANDPYATYLNISCFDLLLIELVPLAERMARSFEESLDRPSLTEKRLTTGNLSGTNAGTDSGGEGEVFKDSVYFRLEGLGFRVGQGLSERFSRDRPRFTDSLDVIKFLCKDLWMIVFKKQIDNLKTNHRASTEDPGCISRLTATGRLRSHRQYVPSFLENEHGRQGRSCTESTAVSLLSVRDHSRCFIELRDQGNGTGRVHRVTHCDIPDQNNSTKDLKVGCS